MQFNSEWTLMNANKDRRFQGSCGRQIDSPDSEPVKNANAVLGDGDWRGAMNFQWKRALTPAPLPAGEGGPADAGYVFSAL